MIVAYNGGPFECCSMPDGGEGAGAEARWARVGQGAGAKPARGKKMGRGRVVLEGDWPALPP